MTMNSTLMMQPAELKQFQNDDAAVAACIGSALSYLGAEERFASAGEELQQRWMDAGECGTLLARIRDTESYRDSHSSWTAYCRSVKCEGCPVSRRHIGRLIKCAEILAKISPSLIGKIGMPLSFRLLGEIGDIDDDELGEIGAEAVNDEDAACDRLNETLQTMRENKAAERTETKVPRNIQWFRKHSSALERCFHELGADERAMPLLRALDELAELLLSEV
jgi:hypothetical protein